MWHQLYSDITTTSPHDESAQVEHEHTSCLAVSEGGLVAIGTVCDQSSQAAETFSLNTECVVTRGRVMACCLDEPETETEIEEEQGEDEARDM